VLTTLAGAQRLGGHGGGPCGRPDAVADRGAQNR
jgi:hypothetical protein